MLLVSDNRQSGHLPAIIGHERLFTCALAEAPARPDDITIIDIDLGDLTTRKAAERLFARARPRRALAIAVDFDSEDARRAARKLGASVLVSRPVTAGILHRLLDSLDPARGPAPVVSAQTQGVAALADAHCAFCSGEALDIGALRMAAADCADAIADYGIHVWLEVAAQSRDGVFRQVLALAGAAAGFGRQLGMNGKDLNLMTLTALVADIGMAGMPQSLIGKNGELDRDETALITRHPVTGFDYLKAHADLPPMVLDAVRHHHEMRDGSGYPDGLSGDAISNLAEVLTVCDLFAALVFSCGADTAPDVFEALAVLEVMAREHRLKPGHVSVLKAALEGVIGWPHQADRRRA